MINAKTTLSDYTLKWLFFELTDACNEHCIHCGSKCGDGRHNELDIETVYNVLSSVQSRCEKLPMVAVTGGEPLIALRFWDIVTLINDMGFKWGMTSNATLIDADVAERLAASGMRTVSVSLDGLPETHDEFRGRRHAYDDAARGTKALVECGKFSDVMVTTVVGTHNFSELQQMFRVVDDMGVDTWRLAAIEPMGRALEHPELMLSDAQHVELLTFISGLRLAGYPVQYGCCHYLGPSFERVVRPWGFVCGSGTFTASVTATGDIVGCLDVERRPETVFGNAKTDDFMDVWESGFELFRQHPSALDGRCIGCGAVGKCKGGSWHSFDFDRGEQRVCMAGKLF